MILHVLPGLRNDGIFRGTHRIYTHWSGKLHYVISIIAVVFLLTSIAMPVSITYASSNDPYNSGYDHGRDDARILVPSDRYINQPEKGGFN